MLLSIALIFMLGMTLGQVCKKCKLPSLIGMLAAGILLGPCVFNLIDTSILSVSSEIRKAALIIILTRAGLEIDLKEIKKIGKTAIFMCFIPASFELIAIIVLAPKLLGLTIQEAAVMGAVLAAVSPAVIVPRMIKLMDEGYGTKKYIPQLILAGATVDDIYVIVLFTTFINMLQGKDVSIMGYVNIPVSILGGILIGLFVGFVLSKYFEKIHVRDTVKVIIIFSCSLIMVAVEAALNTQITFSALIAIMFIGVALQKYRKDASIRLSEKYNKLWVASELLLFVLVGAGININYLGKVGIKALVIIIGALLIRMSGVYVCLIGTKLNIKEKIFIMFAYTPKATVQAAIGGIPLSLGLGCGDAVLTVAVLAIILTAPLGAFAVDLSYKKLLER